MNYGAGLAIMALTSVWAYDAGAFFIGSKFGKHKLSPHFSPKKKLGRVNWRYSFYFCIFVYFRIYRAFFFFNAKNECFTNVNISNNGRDI